MSCLLVMLKIKVERAYIYSLIRRFRRIELCCYGHPKNRALHLQKNGGFQFWLQNKSSDNALRGGLKADWFRNQSGISSCLIYVFGLDGGNVVLFIYANYIVFSF